VQSGGQASTRKRVTTLLSNVVAHEAVISGYDYIVGCVADADKLTPKLVQPIIERPDWLSPAQRSLAEDANRHGEHSTNP